MGPSSRLGWLWRGPRMASTCQIGQHAGGPDQIGPAMDAGGRLAGGDECLHRWRYLSPLLGAASVSSPSHDQESSSSLSQSDCSRCEARLNRTTFYHKGGTIKGCAEARNYSSVDVVVTAYNRERPAVAAEDVCSYRLCVPTIVAGAMEEPVRLHCAIHNSGAHLCINLKNILLEQRPDVRGKIKETEAAWCRMIRSGLDLSRVQTRGSAGSPSRPPGAGRATGAGSRARERGRTGR